MDDQQDCLNFKIKRLKELTKFTFQRPFDTCDENDYIIEVSICIVYFMQYKINNIL